MIARVRRAARLYWNSPQLILIGLPLLPFEVASTLASPDYWILTLPPALFVSVVVGAVLIRASASVIGDEPVRILSSFVAAFARFGSVLAVALSLLGAVLLMLTIIALPLGLNLLVRWWFGPQAVMLRDMTAGRALSFSSSIVRGSWWGTAGQLSAIFSTVLILSLLILASGMLLAEELRMLSYGVAILAAPFVTLFHTLMFYELVQREERARSISAQV